MQFGDRGLNQIMNAPILGLERISDARDRIAPLIKKLVDRAKAQGVVRPDLRPERHDLHAAGAVSDHGQHAGAIAPDLYRRYLTMFLDGIRTDRAEFTPLPTPALTASQTHAAMTRKASRALLPVSRNGCRQGRSRAGAHLGLAGSVSAARRARLVADGGGLENRYGVTPIVGSNPTPSAL